MATIDGKSGPGAICPTCGHKVIFKPVGDSLLSFEIDGTVHRCFPDGEPPARGFSVIGETILNFSLKKRRLTLVLSNDKTLEIFSSLDDERVTMNLTLYSPEGVFKEVK